RRRADILARTVAPTLHRQRECKVGATAPLKIAAAGAARFSRPSGSGARAVDRAVPRASTPRAPDPKESLSMSDANRSVRLHRVLRAPADRVYRAFLDPDAMVKWLPPHGFTAKVHEMDVRVGGGHRMSFTNFTTGASHSFGGRYLELVPGERIRYTDRFDDPD